ncbi:MAG TPA: PPC domain-containing DNA-binding protein [Chthoniobacteraceae bacterium]|jgi:hypothetical protein|nr:PPC domain-containing DNA-binding protein [Chthoniobacteraceae bacterium]
MLNEAGPGERTYAIIFDKGDEVYSGLTRWVKEHGIKAAHFSGIGAFETAMLGYFDRSRKDYRKISFDEQVEVLTLSGDVALSDGEPKIHAHVIIGKSDGSAHGGHLLEAQVWPTLEVILIESNRAMRRRFDPEVGLALIDLDA